MDKSKGTKWLFTSFVKIKERPPQTVNQKEDVRLE